MKPEVDTFLADNIHRQLDLRATYRDLGDRTKKWLVEIAKELCAGARRIGPPEPDAFRGRANLYYWVDCSVRDSREFSWLSVGVAFDSESEYQGQTGAYACAWLTPRGRDMFTEIQEIADREIVGSRPKQDGTIWRDDGRIGMKLVSRNGKRWPPLSDLEKDLRVLYNEALRLIDKLARNKG
jgi:hypothetical protein